MDLLKEKEVIYSQINEKYLNYIYGLAALDKAEIIAQSQRTAFYTDMTIYLQDCTLTKKQMSYLDDEDILPKLYECYLDNDFDHLETMSRGNKVIYQFIKEQISEFQM